MQLEFSLGGEHCTWAKSIAHPLPFDNWLFFNGILAGSDQMWKWYSFGVASTQKKSRMQLKVD
jgi:hypothetical protein